VKGTVLSTSMAICAGTVAFTRCSSTFSVTIFSTRDFPRRRPRLQAPRRAYRDILGAHPEGHPVGAAGRSRGKLSPHRDLQPAWRNHQATIPDGAESRFMAGEPTKVATNVSRGRFRSGAEFRPARCGRGSAPDLVAHAHGLDLSCVTYKRWHRASSQVLSFGAQLSRSWRRLDSALVHEEDRGDARSHALWPPLHLAA